MINLFRIGTAQIWLHLVDYWEVKKSGHNRGNTIIDHDFKND